MIVKQLKDAKWKKHSYMSYDNKENSYRRNVNILDKLLIQHFLNEYVTELSRNTNEIQSTNEVIDNVFDAGLSNEVVEEVLNVNLSERATRLIDGDNEDSMEKKKTEGYF